MGCDRILRAASLCLTMLVLHPGAGLSQSTQTGTARDPGSVNSTNSPYGTGARTLADPLGQRLRYVFISGKVVTDNGLPADPGTVIERICGGMRRREAHVNTAGNFGFQVGADSVTLPDASDSMPNGPGAPGFGSTRQPQGLRSLGSLSAASVVGCELRAQLAGYRSSVVMLDQFQPSGQLDVGTIVLHPVALVPGTLVSAKDLRAPKQARKAFARSEKAMQKMKHEDAEKELRIALELYPEYASAWYKLGMVHLRLQRLEEARGDFRKAIDSDGRFVKPYIELAHIAMIQQRWQEAADITDHALGLDPLDFPGGFFINACANIRLNNLDAAEKSARRTLRLDGSHAFPNAYLVLGNILLKKNDPAGAVEQYRSFLKIAPTAAEAGQVRSIIQQLDSVASNTRK